jgi:hypothetical protein
MPAYALRQRLTAGKPGLAIIGGNRLGAAGDQFLAGFGVTEFGAAGIGKHFLGRIGDLDDVSADAAPGGGADTGLEGLIGVEKISDEDDVAHAADLAEFRQGVLHRCVRQCQRQPFGRVSRGNGFHHAGAADALARAGEDLGQRQHEHQGAALLGDDCNVGLVEHGRRLVGPEPDGVGCFPLAIADIETVVAGGAAPVDTRQRFAFDIGPKLPEGFADAALAAAVPAGDDGVGHAPGFGEAIGQQRRALTGAGKRIKPRSRSGQLADRRHRLTRLSG